MNRVISTIRVQPDGKIVVGGNFGTYNGVPRKSLARLNADGSLDETFRTGIGVGGSVEDLELLPNGNLVVAGNFGSYDFIGASNIFSLLSNGARDNSFVAGSTAFGAVQSRAGSIQDVAILPDGGLFIGASWLNIQEGEHSNSYRTGLARLHPNGTLNGVFNTEAGVQQMGQLWDCNICNRHTIIEIAQQPDGKLVAVGDFDIFNGKRVNGLVRINPGGDTDSSFRPPTGLSPSSLNTVAVQADGKILVGRQNDWATLDRALMRLHPDGSLDEGFPNLPGGITGIVRQVLVQPDGKLLLRMWGKAGQTNVLGIIRLNPDGSIDRTFPPHEIDTETNTTRNNTWIALQPDGKIILFTPYHLRRLNADGSVDNSFRSSNNQTSERAKTVAVQPDGKILLGDYGLARLNPDGSRDEVFNANVRRVGVGDILDIAVMPNGQLLVAGEYSHNSIFYATVLLNPDGTLDATYFARVGSQTGGQSEGPPRVNHILVQHDNQVVLTGNFQAFSRYTYFGIVRLRNGPAGRLQLLRDGVGIANGGTLDFGTVAPGQRRTLRLTLQNTGAGTLRLRDAALPIKVLPGGEYTLDASGIPAILAPGATADFTVTYAPVAVGHRTALLRIDYDSSSGKPHFLNLTGTDGTPTPRIDVSHEGKFLDRGQVFILPQTRVGTSRTVVFAVENSGPDTLLLAKMPRVTLSGAAEFAVTQPVDEKVPPGRSVTFAVVFTPAEAGNQQVQVHIASNDRDTPLLVFSLSAEAFRLPVLQLRQGDSVVELYTAYRFPNVVAGSPSQVVPFTLENIGSSDMVFHNQSPLRIIGNPIPDFILQYDTTVRVLPPGGKLPLSVTFAPQFPGTMRANMYLYGSVYENGGIPWMFEGQASAPPPRLSFRQGTARIPDRGVLALPDTIYVDDSVLIPLDLVNEGAQSLWFRPDSVLTLAGADTSEFSIQRTGDAGIVAGGSLPFTLRFSPRTPGPKTVRLLVNGGRPLASILTATITASPRRRLFPQAIVFVDIPDQTLGGGPVVLSARSTSGLPVVYEVLGAGAVLMGDVVTLTGAGPVTVRATQPGNDRYLPASALEYTFCVNPPKPTVTRQANGLSMRLISSSLAGNQWLKDGKPIAGAVGTFYQVAEPGTYTVQVTVDGCSTVSDPSVVEPKEPDMQVFPNPTSNETVVLYRPRQQMRGVRMQVFNLVGFQLVDAQMVPDGTGVYRYTLRLQALSPGQYMVLIEDGTDTVIRTVIKL